MLHALSHWQWDVAAQMRCILKGAGSLQLSSMEKDYTLLLGIVFERGIALSGDQPPPKNHCFHERVPAEPPSPDFYVGNLEGVIRGYGDTGQENGCYSRSW